MIRIAPEVTKKTASNAKGNAKSRGRPPTGKAMTNAERQAKFKALKRGIKTDGEWLAETAGADG